MSAYFETYSNFLTICQELRDQCVSNPELVDDIIQEHLLDSRELDVFPSIVDFKAGASWFNVLEPLNIDLHLRDKIIILDFWTYCCINCMHILPVLKKLEEKYSAEDGVVIVGVHSAKFDHEKDDINVSNAVARHRITHPVINDGGWMYHSLGISCWPTLLVLGPRNNPIYIHMGENDIQVLEDVIRIALRIYRDRRQIHNRTLPINVNNNIFGTDKNHLSFPGKVACIQNGSNGENLRYAISDTSNNRIIILNNSLKVIRIIGDLEGHRDGNFSDAKFHAPQGVAFLTPNILFVADTENHCVRKLDLLEKQVYTVAGTGKKGDEKSDTNPDLLQDLASPWDVSICRITDREQVAGQPPREKTFVLIAMAGYHQIWAYFLEDTVWFKNRRYLAGTYHCLAGTGKEENRNNSYPHCASFAQPSGISVNPVAKELYIADSESSSIRKMSLDNGKVSAIVGGDRNPLDLYKYGDVDGIGFNAQLQHPLAVAWSTKDNFVYVADSYNNKIKRINLSDNSIATIFQNQSGDQTLNFREPGGLCLTPNCDKLIVADTCNNCVRIIRLSDNECKNISDLSFEYRAKNVGNVEHIFQYDVNAKGAELVINIEIIEDNVVKLTENAPQQWYINDSDYEGVIEANYFFGNYIKPFKLEIKLPESDNNSNKILYVNFNLKVCANSVCMNKSLQYHFKINVTENGLPNIAESLKIQLGSG